MKLQFNSSKDLTIGAEIELQLLDPVTGDLTPKCELLLKNIAPYLGHQKIKPEVTHCMLEIVSGIHGNTNSLDEELRHINNILISEAKKLNIIISGGGSHPFQTWKKRIISSGYEEKYEKYDYLMKKFTVFGQHIHIGCSDPNKAIYLIHAFAQYIPHLIALSASSPFYDGIETTFNSTRLQTIDAFPTSGHFPLIKNWNEFCDYIKKMKSLNIIDDVKSNIYSDIRLKPEFGTIEIRVCDTALTLNTAVALTAYCQTLSMFILKNSEMEIKPDHYFFYKNNRFQASRYGLEGKISSGNEKKPIFISEDILNTIEKISTCAETLGNSSYLEYLKKLVLNKDNGAEKIRMAYSMTKNTNELAKYQSRLWMYDDNQ